MKYWEILLIKKQEKGKKGLTLPFLIGSQIYLPNNYIRQNIRDVIFEMTYMNSFETCIRFCLSTQTFIFEIRNPKNNVYYPTINNCKQKGLSVSEFYKQKFGETIEELCSILEDDFQFIINDGKFSAESNVEDRSANWLNFSTDDINFIKESFILI